MRLIARTLIPTLFGLALAGCVITTQEADTTEPTTPPPAPSTPETRDHRQPDGQTVPTTPGTVDPTPQGEPIAITLERTPCFGRCPVYEVTLHQDGAVVFHGKQHVTRQGVERYTVDPQAVRALAEEIQQAGFFEMKDCYCEQQITDLPYAILTVKIGDRHHRVKHYHGDRTAPAALKTLEDRVDAVANTNRFQTVQ